MSGFRHVLLTRFNVRGFLAPPPDAAAWLEHRADLFERVCLPSVRAQTRGGFRWLVLFDEATPAAFRERVRRWAEWEPLVPCFLPSVAGLDPVALVAAHGGLDRTFLLTTRLDNDDALARDFVAEVQDRFAEQSCLFVNFDRGAKLSQGRAYAAAHRSNPFISLIERSDRARTVWCDEHTRLAGRGPVEHVGGPPMWLQTVHEHNVSNRVGAARRLPPRRVVERFAIDPALLDAADRPLGRGIENVRLALFRSAARLRGGRDDAAAAAAPAPPDPPPLPAEADAPTFSVVVPTCGRAEMLDRALVSLAAQGRRDFEVVVVDDASEDATPALLAAAAAEGRVPRLVTVRHERRAGASAARNSGARAARGAWVVFLDDDDELLPDTLERLAGFLAAAPDLAFAWGGVERVDHRGRPAGRVEWPAAGANRFAHLGAGSGYALTVRRDLLEDVGGFDESLAAGVDFDLLLRLGARFRGRPLPGVVARVHLHRAPRLTDASAAKAESFERIAEKHRPFLLRHPPVGLPFLLKAARLSYAAGRRRAGRPLLLRALRLSPRRPRTWKTALCLELFGTERLALRRRLGRLVRPRRRPPGAAVEPGPAEPLLGRPAPPTSADGPFFSVVVPTRDRAARLARALASVLDQDFAPFELVVVDDASSDATPEVLAAISDPRLVVVRREERGGAAAARNTGVSRASGRWLSFLDDDDAFRPGFLSAMHAALSAAPPDVGFAWCGIERVREQADGSRARIEAGAWQPQFPNRRAAYLGFLRRRHIGTSCGLVVRRSTFAEIGGFDESLACAEDTDLLIRLARHAGFVTVPDVLVEISVHPGPRLTSYGGAMAAAYERIFAKHGEALAAEPSIRAALEYKAGWLRYRSGDRSCGRRHLARSLAARPLQVRGWAALLLFEIFGRRAPAIHDRLSGWLHR